MVSTDFEVIRRKARVRYELRRLRMGVVGALPLAVVAGITVLFAHDRAQTLWLGVAATLMAAVMIVYGRSPQRAVLPGIAAGCVPLALALCANRMHGCTDDACASLCLPACALGGVVAGISVASVAVQIRLGLGFWIPASILAILTGSLGCSCVGYSGIVGLVIGYGAGVVPALLRRLVGTTRR